MREMWKEVEGTRSSILKSMLREVKITNFKSYLSNQADLS